MVGDERKREGSLPTVEFEGPLGRFWPMGEVPVEALAKAVKEIFDEVRRRGWKEEHFIQLVKKEAEG